MTAASVLGLPLLGALLGLVQQAWYRRRVAQGTMAAEDIPFFGILLLRGMIAGFVLIGLLAVASQVGAGPVGPAQGPTIPAPAP